MTNNIESGVVECIKPWCRNAIKIKRKNECSLSQLLNFWYLLFLYINIPCMYEYGSLEKFKRGDEWGY